MIIDSKRCRQTPSLSNTNVTRPGMPSAPKAVETGAGIAQPMAGNGGAPAGNTERDQLREALAAPEMNPQHPKFDKAKYDELDARYQRVIGN